MNSKISFLPICILGLSFFSRGAAADLPPEEDGKDKEIHARILHTDEFGSMYRLVLTSMPGFNTHIGHYVGYKIAQFYKKFARQGKHASLLRDLFMSEVGRHEYTTKLVQDNYRALQRDWTELHVEVGMLPYIRRISLFQQKLKNDRLFLNFLWALLGKQKIYHIPHIHHRLWITSEDSPQEPPADSLGMYLRSLRMFPSDWKHIFWCIDPEKLPNTIAALQRSSVPVEIRSVRDIMASMPGKYLTNRLYDEKHYAIAGDLIKRYIVYTIGGFYNDVGIGWKKDPTKFVDSFDRIVNLTSIYQPDVGICAAPAHSPIEEKFFRILDAFSSLPEDIRSHFTGRNIMRLTWIPTYKTLLDTELRYTDRIFYWDQDETYYRDWVHYGTWIFGTLGSKPMTASSTEW